MKRTIPLLGAGLSLLLLSALATAGDLEDKLDEKLKKEFVGNAAWTTDFEAAKAKETGKVIFAYFTRSYAP